MSRYVQKLVVKNADIILTNTNENLRLLAGSGIKNAYEVYPGLNVHYNIPCFDGRQNISISVTMWDYGRHPEKIAEIWEKIEIGKIYIVGSWTDNEYLNNFRDAIKAKVFCDKIVVTGRISEEELLNLYKMVKVTVMFGYNKKNSGMDNLEAISLSLPLIINNGIGIKEVVRNEENGFIVNETDTNKILETPPSNGGK